MTLHRHARLAQFVAVPVLLSSFFAAGSFAQQPVSPRQLSAPSDFETAPEFASTEPVKPPSPGDSPEGNFPLAKDLSGKLKPRDIEKAMRKVADWELARTRDNLSTDWTYAVLEIGFVTASDTLRQPSYRNAVLQFGERNGWRLGRRLTHADDQVIGQSYLHLYEQEHKPEMIAPLRRRFDQQKAIPDDPERLIWWWCDALFMAPPAWSGLARVTGDRSYLDYMDREWWITAAKLYDPNEHLFSRDASFLDRKEANGKKIFWLRGEGWVIAGLARTLQNMPADYPARPKYVQMFKEMAERFRSLQTKDGLWRAGMLDESAYPLPEVSGSSLATYAMAWGINNGLLDRKTYLPVVKDAWKGLVSHIYADGRLGCIQPVGAKPDPFRETSSYVYGVGAFLLAGSELDKTAGARKH